MNKVVNRIDKLLEMISKAYRFFLINLMLERMKHRVDGVENKLDQITETLEALNENKKSIQLKLENLNKEVDAIVNS